VKKAQASVSIKRKKKDRRKDVKEDVFETRLQNKTSLSVPVQTRADKRPLQCSDGAAGTRHYPDCLQ
jgi:hypothetical protein